MQQAKDGRVHGCYDSVGRVVHVGASTFIIPFLPGTTYELKWRRVPGSPSAYVVTGSKVAR